MFSHFTQPIINFFSQLTQIFLILAILISIFSFIYLGIKIYFSKGNYKDFKLTLIFTVLGLLILGIIFINRELIFDLIKIFIPNF
ncbi:MAG: hypothetical protein NZ866_00050 [Patescibacteria group bacterium]|nr:hypothetical protein [Patescibacteria group bacterium]